MSRSHERPQVVLDIRTVERLLGSETAAAVRRAGDGCAAFGLLGVDVETSTDANIEASLQRQLDRVAHHPEGDSATADTLRLALHEAAAELQDPARRAAAIARFNRPSRSPIPVVTPGSEPALPPRADEPAPGPVYRPRAGGDPLVSRMLVVGFALLLAMVAITVVGALILTSGSSVVQSGSGATEGQGEAPRADSQPPVAASGSGAASPEVESSDPVPAASPPSPSGSQPRKRVDFADPGLVIRQLRAASTASRDDPDKALKQFRDGFEAAADWWCRFDTDQRSAASDAVVEFIYRVAAEPDLAARALAIVTEPAAAAGPAASSIVADQVWPAAFSAGMIARLNRERDLPTMFATAVAREFDQKVTGGDRELARTSGFDGGAAAAMRRVPAVIFAAPAPTSDRVAAQRPTEQQAQQAKQTLERWIEGLSLWKSDEPLVRERILVDALGWLLVNGAEPEADPRTFQAISTLAVEIRWLPGGPARPALVGWLRDPQVNGSDLRVLTAAVATRSGAESVDATMVLPMTSTAEARESLRARFAAAWGLAEAAARAEGAERWMAAAELAIASTPRTDDPADQLALAAAIARVSTTAAVLWRGGPQPTDPLFQPPAVAKTATTSAPSPHTITIYQRSAGTATAASGDGAWAERYLAAERNIPVRLERLADLERSGGSIGPVDAAVLAEAACFASPAQVRVEAQRVVGVFADQPAVVGAMLDILTIAPRSTTLSEAYAMVAASSLPRPTDPDWELATRRALVERLLGMLSTTGIHGDVEASATSIATSYESAVGQSGGTAESQSAESAVVYAAAVAADLRREAGSTPVTRSVRFSLDTIDRRADERRSQAIGPVQAFVAEQSAIADLLAFLVAAERPVSEAEVATVIDELTSRRRRSSHVFGQVLANEQAIVRLWMIRYSGRVLPGSGGAS